MLSEFQKQNNRIYFFSNKITTSGKITMTPKYFKPMSNLLDKLKHQVEEKVKDEIEVELTKDQLEYRIKTFLPSILKNLDLENTSYKDYHKMFINDNILSRKDINNYKDFIKQLIDQEIQLYLDSRQKEEVKQKLDILVLDEQEEKESKKKKSLSEDDKLVKELIDNILNSNEDKKLSSSDFDTIFKKLNVPVTQWELNDIIYNLNQECKIPPSLHKISLEAASEIADIIYNEKNIKINKYIILSMLGRHSAVHNLKNILTDNYKNLDC